jgi:DNA polymerase-3 subunit delta'
VGKEEAALAFAQALDCQAGENPDEQADLFGTADPAPTLTDTHGLGGCGICTDCTRIGRYVHPDVIVRLPLPRPKRTESGGLNPADPSEALSYKAEHPWRDPVLEKNLTIGVDDVRAVIRQLAYPPGEAKMRVVLFREAERMTAEAQNALLKSLEESPAHTVFILTTHQPEQLLPTVRSRCQRVPFGPLPEATIAAYLKEQGIGSDLDVPVAGVARGSLKRALLVAEEGVAGREEALQLLRWAAEGERLEPLEMAAAYTFRSGGSALTDARHILEELVSLTRDLAMLATDPEAGLLNPDQRSLLQPIASSAPAGAALKALEAAVSARGEVDSQVNLALIYSTLSEALRPLGG